MDFRAAFLAVFAVSLSLLGAIPATAEAARHAAMVIDANTGKVLYQNEADAPRRPASLTKMMTLYLVFEEMRRGRLSYETRIRMTEAGASVAPSKLDLEPGEDLALIDAIKALITKSANDVAVALAEHIAGSEAAFARRMSERARQLGMTNTLFRNASGLPDDEQVTTARDMLTLALRLNDDFPNQFRLFSLRSFTFRGKTYKTHNTLMHSFQGMDGIKTGYTRESGFNVVTSVRHGGRHVVGAMFGGATASSRNSQMRYLLKRAMADAATELTRVSKPALVAAPAPVPRPAAKPKMVAEARPLATPAEPKTKPAPAATKTAAPAQPAVPAAAEDEAQALAASGVPIQIVTVKPMPIQLAPRSDAAPERPADALADRMAAATPAAKPIAAAATPKLDFGAPRPESTLSARAAAPSAPPPTLPPAATESVQPKSNRAAPGRAPSTFQEQLALLADAPAAAPRAVRQEAATRSAAVARPPSTLQAQASNLTPAGLSTKPANRRPPPGDGQAAYHLAGPDGSQQTATRNDGGAASYEVEIGVFPTADAAEQRLDSARARIPGLGKHAGLALPVPNGNRLLYRARFTGFAEADASSACIELRRLPVDCRVARGE